MLKLYFGIFIHIDRNIYTYAEYWHIVECCSALNACSQGNRFYFYLNFSYIHSIHAFSSASLLCFALLQYLYAFLIQSVDHANNVSILNAKNGEKFRFCSLRRFLLLSNGLYLSGRLWLLHLCNTQHNVCNANVKPAHSNVCTERMATQVSFACPVEREQKKKNKIPFS